MIGSTRRRFGKSYRCNKWPIKNDLKIRSITRAGAHHLSLLPPPSRELDPAVRALGCSAEIPARVVEEAWQNNNAAGPADRRRVLPDFHSQSISRPRSCQGSTISRRPRSRLFGENEVTVAPLSPPWFQSRMPTAEECSIGARLVTLANMDPTSPFMVASDGSATTRAELRDLALELAGRLAGLGVKPGDRVFVWLPNSLEMVRTIFALSMLSATIVALNTSMRGSVLANMIAISDAEIMICHPALLGRLSEIEIRGLRTVVLPGSREGECDGLKVVSESSLQCRNLEPAANQPWDIAAIIFSSGTTGPSKGVRVPFGQVSTLSRVFYGYMRQDDRMLLMYPLFHIAGFSALFGAVNAEASIAVTQAFSATDFWNVIRRTGSTTVPGLGPTFISILDKAAPSPSDTDNTLRHVIVQKISEEARAFATRFGIDIMACYSMTETSGICISRMNDEKLGIVGRPRDGLQVRIVDVNDIEVPVGEPGELVVRADLPWTLNAGYQGNAEATVTAWRNGWFHTGDVVRRDAEGDISFVDRKKDVIRRRSENISSSEVEAEVRLFPAVQDAAAIAVSHRGDEEVLIVVAPVPGREIDPRALIEFLIPRMPHFMVPRFVRIMTEVPKTDTNRVQKETLREAGLTPDCWDRESSGIQLRGQWLNQLTE